MMLSRADSVYRRNSMRTPSTTLIWCSNISRLDNRNSRNTNSRLHRRVHSRAISSLHHRSRNTSLVNNRDLLVRHHPSVEDKQDLPDR